MSRYAASGCKVYVGNLSDYGSVKDLESAFCGFGPLKHVWVAKKPPGFAFVEFEDPRDASDSVRELNDTMVCGRRVVVEVATGEKRQGSSSSSSSSRRSSGGSSYGSGGGGGGYGGGGGRYQQRRSFNDDKCYECAKTGHFARECPYKWHRRRSRSRSRSNDRYSSHKRYSPQSRSRSRSPYRS